MLQCSEQYILRLEIMNKKSPLMRILFPASRKFRCGALLVATLLGSLSLASGQTWTATTNGTWSNSANWAGGVPATSGATVTLNGTVTDVTSTIDSAWSANGSVSGLNFVMGAGKFYLNPGAGVTDFSIGSGGIITNSGTIGSTYLQGPVTLTANQTWNLNGTTGFFRIDGTSVLNVGAGVTLTKTGAQVLYVASGNGTFAGNYVENGGQTAFAYSNQYNRLGNNITFQNSDATASFAYTNTNNNATVSANYVFAETGTSNRFGLTMTPTAGATATGQMSFTGNWSSTNAISGSSLGNSIRLASGAAPTNSSFANAFTYNITGDNSALTSAVTSNATTGAFKITSGIWVAGSANALGASNGLSVNIGEISSSASGVAAGFWSKGYDVGATITTALNTNAAPQSEVITIGNSNTSGTATFSGPISFTKSATANQVPTVNLVSNVGSRANFSGNIADA
ncbi:MAG: hypothetical protein WC765_07695, partial [Phycisphaerae bacterium]